MRSFGDRTTLSKSDLNDDSTSMDMYVKSNQSPSHSLNLNPRPSINENNISVVSPVELRQGLMSETQHEPYPSDHKLIGHSQKPYIFSSHISEQTTTNYLLNASMVPSPRVNYSAGSVNNNAAIAVPRSDAPVVSQSSDSNVINTASVANNRNFDSGTWSASKYPRDSDDHSYVNIDYSKPI